MNYIEERLSCVEKAVRFLLERELVGTRVENYSFKNQQVGGRISEVNADLKPILSLDEPLVDRERGGRPETHNWLPISLAHLED